MEMQFFINIGGYLIGAIRFISQIHFKSLVYYDFYGHVFDIETIWVEKGRRRILELFHSKFIITGKVWLIK